MVEQVKFDGLEVQSQPGADVDYSIIWLHGLGADARDFEPIVPHLGLANGLGVRFVFPNAPVRPITVNGGMRMRGWYDIDSMDFNQRSEDVTGINASAEYVEALIEREVSRGTPYDRIILAGFSQGGVIALRAGLRFAKPLAGIVALSTYLPKESTDAAGRSDANRNTPIFYGHGEYDPVIPLFLADKSQTILKEWGYPLVWKTYPMEHSVSPEEIQDLSLFLQGLVR